MTDWGELLFRCLVLMGVYFLVGVAIGKFRREK